MMRSQQHPDSLQPISHACNSKLKAAVATTVVHVMNYSSPPQNKCVIYYVCFRRCHSRTWSSVSETVWPARHGHIFQVKPALQSFIPLLLTSDRGHIGPSQDTHTPFTHTLNLEPPIRLMCMFLRCGRKLWYLEKTTSLLPASVLINSDLIKVN